MTINPMFGTAAVILAMWIGLAGMLWLALFLSMEAVRMFGLWFGWYRDFLKFLFAVRRQEREAKRASSPEEGQVS